MLDEIVDCIPVFVDKPAEIIAIFNQLESNVQCETSRKILERFLYNVGVTMGVFYLPMTSVDVFAKKAQIYNILLGSK